MSSDPTPVPTPPDPGLPPVEPPTGQMIVRLFLVPALIVGVLVTLFLLGPTLSGWFNRLVGRTPGSDGVAARYLRDLDNPNPEVRYRTASDLAQVLLRNEDLAANAGFAVDLADRLRTAVDESAEPEQKYAAHVEAVSRLTGAKREAEEKALVREVKQLEPHRNLIMFLGACLGNCTVPAGAPILRELATQESGVETDALAERRRRALFALATLGDKLQRYDKLGDEAKDAIETQLADAIADENRDRGKTARPTRDYLKARRQGQAGSFGVLAALKKCADDDDPSLRVLAAFAANFWRGTVAEESAAEEFLVALSNDSGRGHDKLAERLAKNPDSKRSRELTRKPGFDVQANATIALARRGSPRVRLDLLEEMLDPAGLREVYVVEGAPAAASTWQSGGSSLAIVLALVGLAVCLGSRWVGPSPRVLLLGLGLVLIAAAPMMVWGPFAPRAQEQPAPALPRPRGTEQPNEALVVLTVTDSLKAVEQLGQLRSEMELGGVVKAVDKLTADPNPAVSTQARATQLALQRRK